MRKKFFIFWFLFFTVLSVTAQVNFLSVTDEDRHTHKEDFWHTFEYYIVSDAGRTTKCQATRIAKNWFATAAHCVASSCNNKCTLRLDLLEQPISAFVSAQHSAKKQIVFVHPQYKVTSPLPVAHDFALLHIDIARLPSVYYRRATKTQKQNEAISRAAFQNFLQQNAGARREFNRVMHPQLPPLLVFKHATKRINSTLSVISIFDGKRHILHNPYPSDYVKEFGFAYTQNFGVREGMSGSGVMTNTGELAGIISSYLGIGNGTKEKHKQYFMFAVFNPDLMQFVKDTMGSDYYKMDLKDATAAYVGPSPVNHKNMIQIVQQMQQSPRAQNPSPQP